MFVKNIYLTQPINIVHPELIEKLEKVERSKFQYADIRKSNRINQTVYFGKRYDYQIGTTTSKDNIHLRGKTVLYQKIGGGKERRLKSVVFDMPKRLSKVLNNLAQDREVTEELSYYKASPEKVLRRIQKEITDNSELLDIKIKSLYDYGARAYVFEMDNGNILKITSQNHFGDRQPEMFDLPIIKSGKISQKGFYYYYIEEKATQNDLEKQEIFEVIDEIKKHGYILDDGLNKNNLRLEQFGRGKDGKVYLLDPECAIIDNSIWVPKNKFLRFVFNVDSAIPPKAFKFKNLF